MSLFTRDMACQELVELVTAYFDGSLSRSDRRSFRSSVAGSSRRSARSESERPCDDSGWSSSRASIVRSTERSKRVARLDMTTLHQQLNDLSRN